MARFDGKVAIVTGAASGIGRAVTHRLGAEGGQVVAVDIDRHGAEEVARTVNDAGGECLALQCDVSDPDQVREAVAATVRRFGRLHILANCAGIYLEDDSFVEDITEETWDRVMDVNLMGPFYFCRYAVPEIVTCGGGAVVNISSTAALRVSNKPAYASSKGALVSLTRCVARQFGESNVRVNAICPGQTETGLAEGARRHKPHPALANRRAPSIQDRMADPSEIAAVALFLASDEASYITSSVYPVDGGLGII